MNYMSMKLESLLVRLDSLSRSGLSLVALALAIPAIAFRAWAINGSWFWLDDYRFLQVQANGKADLSWILEPQDVHFIPLGKLLTLFVSTSNTPFDWNLVTFQMTILFVIALASCWWMLTVVFGYRPLVLVPFVFFAFGTMGFTGTLWWAAALGYYPNIIFTFLLLGFFIKYLRTRSYNALVATLTSAGFGLAATERMLLGLPILFILAISYFAEGGILRRIRLATRDYFLAWISIGILATAYLYIFFTAGEEATSSPEFESIVDTVDFSIGRMFGSMLIGGPGRWIIGWGMQVDPRPILLGLSWLLIGAFLMYSFIRYKGAILALPIVLAPVIGLATLISWGRGDLLPPEVMGNESRYMMDVAPFATFSLALLLMPIVGARYALRERSPLVNVPHGRPLSALLMAMFVSLSMYSNINYAKSWNSQIEDRGRLYVENVRKSAGQDSKEVGEGVVPPTVLPDWFAGISRYSTFFSPLGQNFRVVEFGNNLHTIDARGNVRKAFVGSSPVNPPGPEACGYLVSGDSVTIPVEQTSALGSWLSFGYLSGENGEVDVTTGETRTQFPVTKGLNTGFVFLYESVDEVTFRPTDGSVICVDVIRSGNLVPIMKAE